MKRDYEISLWTHDDEFLATLGSSTVQYNREIYSPVFQRAASGEVTFNFSIPIFCYNSQTKQWENNEKWYNELKGLGNLAPEKKVKLIYDKGTSKQVIHEFVITVVDEKREGSACICSISCTGLAFKELEKIGYQLTLDADTILLEEEEKGIDIEPTLNYWMNKVCPKDTKGVLLGNWDYEIRMKHDNPLLDSTRVYEESHVSDWTDNGTVLQPVYEAEKKEKTGFPSISDSNYYNITQDLAELFGVYVFYEYTYGQSDAPYKITGRKIIFYNNFIQDDEYAITYGNNETSINRTIDSNALVSVMYVEPIETEYTPSGLLSISEAPNNKVKDNFYLNFDYFINTGLMNSMQADAIPVFEYNLRKVNLKLDTTVKKQMQLSTNLVTCETNIATLNDRISAAQTMVNDYTDKISAMSTSLTSSVLKETTSYVVNADGQIVFRRNGVQDNGTFSIKRGTGAAITGYTKNKDGYGYIKTVTMPASVEVGTVVSATYKYDLLSFYRGEVQTYTASVNTLTQQLAEQVKSMGDADGSTEKANGTLYEQIRYYNTQYKNQADEKNTIVAKFQQVMGYFFREGIWTPNDYNAPYSQKHEKFTITYELTPQDGEQVAWYYMNTNLDKQYYNYIVATSIASNINSLEDLVILEKWTENETEYTKQYLFNAHYMPYYSSIGGTRTFILLLGKGISTNTSNRKLYYTNRSGTQVDITSLYRAGGIRYVSGTTSGNVNELMYRRVRIPEDNVITNQISIDNLTEFDDYFTTIENGKIVISLKINNNLTTSATAVTVNYKVDRAIEQLYNDGLEVAKTSAFPQTSYNVNFVNTEQAISMTPSFTVPSAYRMVSAPINENKSLILGGITRINDPDLKLKGIRGYISEITLHLEQPQNDTFAVQSYKTKFEDLFGRVFATSEQISARGYTYERAASVILPTNEIKGSVLQQTITNNDIVFTNGYASGVTMGPEGIIIENTYAYQNGVKGQVVLKGGAILLSNSVNANGKRIYTTGITPEGINLAVATIGRLDTEKVNIYSGDQVRHTWKADGMYAYGLASDEITTDFNQWVRFNSDGLLFTLDDGINEILKLSWDGLTMNSPDGSLSLSPGGGLVISGQEGAIKLTSQEGLKIFDESKHLKVWLGEFANDAYGLAIYDNSQGYVLRTYENDGAGRLWLAGNLDIGFSGTNYVLAGISGNTKGSLFNDQDVIDLGLAVNVAEYQLDTSIRFFSGYTDSAIYDGYEVLIPSFAVLHNGTLFASKAIIQGEIRADSGYFSGVLTGATGVFSGTVYAQDGSFTGVINANGGTITNDLIIENGAILVGDSGIANEYIYNEDGQNVLFWLGGIFDDDGVLIDSALQYIVGEGLNIKGNLTAYATTLEEYIYINGGTSGMGVVGIPTVNGEFVNIRMWAGADLDPLNINTANNSYFYVTEDGLLSAKSVTLSGDMTIVNGYISGNLVVDNANDYVTIISGLDANPVIETMYKDTPVFQVSRTGVLSAKDMILTGSLDVQNNAKLSGNLVVGANSSIMSENYLSGISGWRVGYGDDDYFAEFVNIKVRGELTSSVFRYDTISAVGGELMVRPSILVTSDCTLQWDENRDYYFVLEKESYGSLVNFANGQKVILQAIVRMGYTMEGQMKGECVEISDESIAIQKLSSADFPMGLVSEMLAGSSIISEVTGQADVGIKLTAIDEFGPFIDIYSGEFDSIVRIGSLSGVYSPYFGAITGYGLYAADAFLTGRLYLPNAGITNEGDSNTSVRMWAGASPANRADAPFRVLQNGTMYARDGIFSGQIISDSSSSFNGTIQALGIVIDNFNKNEFFVGYVDQPQSDDDYVLKINSSGLTIYDGGLTVYSDWANGINSSGLITIPYGGNSKIPYYYLNDEKMRFVSKAGHFFSVASNKNYNSILIDDGYIFFNRGSLGGDYKATENATITGNNYIKYDGTNLSMVGNMVQIGSGKEVQINAPIVTVIGNIENIGTVETLLGKMLIKYEAKTVDFYYRES